MAIAKQSATESGIEIIPKGTPGAEKIEAAIVQGDLAKLTPEERVNYYGSVCKSVGLNPLTKPFAYISLNGKLVLYATRDCTDQIRKLHGVSIRAVNSRTTSEGLFIVTANASDKDGREDMATGAVSITGLKGEALANAIMKAETKAKRRVTLSICGLGILDELEVADADDPPTPPVQQPERKSATAERPGPAQAQPSTPAPAKPANGNAEYITPAQRKNFFELVTEGGWSTEQVKEILKIEFCVDTSSKIPANRFLDVCARFKHLDEPETTLPLGYEATNDDIPF